MLAATLDLPYPILSTTTFPESTFEIESGLQKLQLLVYRSTTHRLLDMSCDVLVVGGSTAALAAALSAADDAPSSTVCLTEPTDWLGGS